MTQPVIRKETPAEKAAIYAVEKAAFDSDAEPKLVDVLRQLGGLVLSLVAELDGQIVGHIAFSPMSIEGADRYLRPVALGPVAVLPDYQKSGIGGALIRQGISECKASGYDLMFLLGHTEYYPRFGFVPAVPLGYRSVYTQGEGDHPHFMVLPMHDDDDLTLKGGFVRYHPAFDAL